MLIRCPECGKKISDKVEACPHCGAPQPASLRIAALEQQRLARRKAIRITATILTVTILAAGTTFALIYRWPISYKVGTVTGTDMISQEELVKIVGEAAATWNRAAGRTVAWRLPLGKRVKFDIEVDESLQKYLTTLAGLEQVEAAFLAAKNNAAKELNIFGEQATHERNLLAATVEWTRAYDRLQAFRKTATYTEEPGDIDAGVNRTEGSPTTVVVTWLPNRYTLTDVVVHQFGHLLLGTYDRYDPPISYTAAPLKSPWKLHLFDSSQ